MDQLFEEHKVFPVNKNEFMDPMGGVGARNPDNMSQKQQFQETLDTAMKNYARTGTKLPPTAADELKDAGEGHIQHNTIPPDDEIEEEEEIIEEYAMK